MVAAPRRWFLLLVSGALLSGGLVAATPAGATAAQEADSSEPPPASARVCAATGYLVGSDAELAQLQEELDERGPQRAGGVPLDRVGSWVIPDGERPVVVLDTAGPVISGADVSVAVAGQRFVVSTVNFDAARDRFVTTVELPHLGPTVRSVGLAVDASPCELAVPLSVDRPVWSTRVGGAAAALTVLAGVLVVLVGRRRRAGWGRRFGLAAPLGLLAGVGLAVVLLEAGAVGPFDAVPWWPPVVGLGLAAVLPLTRWRRRSTAPPSAPGAPAGQWPVPAHAPLGGYRLDEVVAASDVAAVYRATRVRVAADPAGTGGERALLKVVVAARYGDPAARLRVEREVAALSGLAHPNLLRLRESLPAAGTGPPTLVFEDLPGAPLRQLLQGGGGLSGPQAVSVVLDLLAGVAAVHARGLVHRDIRPEQVWLAVDGSVRLGGFELACAGVEHPAAPDGAEPYASPEQRAGHVLDGRSDLWACGVVLGELLTGQPRPDPGGLPDPLARLLGRALADDPADRPATAEQFAAELREAAQAAFGVDWTGRGALAGAVVAHGAVAAGTGGYALAGAAGTAGVGTGGAAVTAGLGTAGSGAATGAAGLGAVGTGALGAAAGTGVVHSAAAPAVPAGTAGSAGGGTGLGAAVNAAVAVVAGVVVAAGVVLVDPGPAQARPVVVTPEQARVIFVRTVGEAQDREEEHLGEGVLRMVTSLLDEDSAIADGELTAIEVGVPPGQHAYPAWFLASGQLRYGDGEDELVYLTSRFDRESADEPWLMTGLVWSAEDLGALVTDEDGWLAPAPPPAELVLDPADLPERYSGWLDQTWQDHQLAEDELLEPRADDVSLIVSQVENARALLEDGHLDEQMSIRQETVPEPAEPVVVRLADGRVLVSFYTIVEGTGYNRPGHTSGACETSGFSDWRYESLLPDDDDSYRELGTYLRVHVLAWVPPAAAAGAEPDPVLVDDRFLEVGPRPERSVPC